MIAAFVSRYWKPAAVAGMAVLVGLGLGALIFGGGPDPANQEHAGHDHAAGEEEEATVWTCSMHPSVRMDEPGQCPICGMDLIPAGAAAEDDNPRHITLSPSARALAEVRTAPVTREPVAQQVPLVGRVTYDETLVRRVSSYVPGRIERLYVEVTGTPVEQGEHLLRIYSPELLAAQNELVQALKRLKSAPKGTAAYNVLKKTAEGAEERLRLWGLGPRALSRLKSSGQPQETLTIYAPQSGVVVERHALPGMYVKEGSPLYTVAELDHLWVELDVYEADLPLVRYGQEVILEADALPGRAFLGQVVFVSPVVDDATRAIRVRVNVDNEEGLLKPGMLVRARLQARVDAHGHAVADADLAGLYVCPMHPDETSTTPGRCPVCGMRMEPAEELGLVGQGPDQDPLVVPASAPLITGQRAVVYVEVPNRERPTYEGREVRLGPRVGDHYVVLEGLDEGEQVVVEGAFKLDAAMQVEAKPSMLSLRPAAEPVEPEAHADLKPATRPARERAPRGQARPTPKTSSAKPAVEDESRPASADVAALAPAVDAYLALEDALTGSDLEQAKAAAATFEKKAKAALLPTPPPGFAPHRGRILAEAGKIAAAGDLAAARLAFSPLSASLIAALEASGAPPGQKLHKFFCPMANKGAGATWLQTEEELTNPYFGDKMLGCGAHEGTIVAKGPAAP